VIFERCRVRAEPVFFSQIWSQNPFCIESAEIDQDRRKVSNGPRVRWRASTTCSSVSAIRL